MANLPIEERLLHYFLAMGAQPAEQLPNTQPGLSLTLGLEKVHVAILKTSALTERNTILETILALSSLRVTVNQIYLAAPRLLGTTIDAGVFRSHGIGLVLYDDRRIDEVVPAQPTQLPTPAPIAPTLDPGVSSELAALKSMYFEMEQTISKLKDELRTFQQAGPSPPHLDNSPSTPLIHDPPRYGGLGSDLPSFFANNPWLDVLAKRGREESGPLAG